jgi:hypothetical protein
LEGDGAGAALYKETKSTLAGSAVKQTAAPSAKRPFLLARP